MDKEQEKLLVKLNSERTRLQNAENIKQKEIDRLKSKEVNND